MTDEELTRATEAARACIRDPTWGDERERAVLRATERALAAPPVRVARGIAAGAAMLALAAVVVLWITTRRPAPEAAAPGTLPSAATAPSGEPRDPRTVVLADGSTAEPRSADTTLRLVEDSPSLSRCALQRGTGRFQVTKNPARTFRVEVGAIQVEVVGTKFDVERRDDDSVHVTVESGRVRVSGGDHARDLTAGEDDVFFAGGGSADAAAAPSTAPSGSTPSLALPAVGADWTTLARSGDYDAAYAAVSKRGGTGAVRDEPNELLLAADVARLSGHPEQAVGPLRRVLARHRQDPRAALAAFTLGRVLLDGLGQPRESAVAFADAYALDPAGSLAEDALVREVEAWSRAGDATRAQQRGRTSLQRFPNGARTRQVKKLAEIE